MDGTSARTGSEPAADHGGVEARIRLRPSPHRGGAFRLALAAGLALVTVLAAASLVLPPEPAAAIPIPPHPAAPAWIDIRQPFQLFDLAGSPFAKLPLAYAARRRPDGSARQDTLAFGAFAPAGRFLRFTVAWGDGRPAEQPDLVVDLARFAASDGLAVMRVGRPASLPTRFGLAVTAALELRRDDVALPCLGFRLETTGPARAVGLIGVMCGTAGHPAEPAELACVVDRIDLASAGDDPALRDFFVAAERRRGPACDKSAPVGNGQASRGLFNPT